MKKIYKNRIMHMSIVFLFAINGIAQVPFECTGQLFGILEMSNSLVEMEIDPSNSRIRFRTINPDLGRSVNALGFRSTDNLLYALDPVLFDLLRIDALGNIEVLANLPLTSGVQYLAGDVTPDGRFLVALGEENGINVEVVRIDLDNPSFPVQINPMTGDLQIRDFSFDPLDGTKGHGYDAAERKFTRIDFNTLSFFNLLTNPDGLQNDFFGAYYDSFGNLNAFGSTAFGVASAIFSIQEADGRESVRATGPENPVLDIAACPYTVDIEHFVDPVSTLSCSEVTYYYAISNQTAVTQTSLDFSVQLPNDFEVIEVIKEPFGGTYAQTMNLYTIDNMTIPRGIDTIIFQVEIGEVEDGKYSDQASLEGLPVFLGSERLSDNPVTVREDDSTSVIVNVISEDSIVTERFFCLGEQITLDGSQYGNQLTWNTGSNAPRITIDVGGTYVLEAVSGCQEVTVIFDVVQASCPFTIELDHVIMPDSTLPCAEVIYRYIIENDTGVDYDNISFRDTLSSELVILDFLTDPFGGKLDGNTPNHIINIDEIVVGVGFDTMDILVEVGNVSPGSYQNRAVIYGFPVDLGPRRFSDDPTTPKEDSTTLEVLGLESDSLVLQAYICEGNSVTLDATPYGMDYLWEDGSTGSTFEAQSPGIYQVILFDGCEVSYLFFDVEEGDRINVEAPFLSQIIDLGDSLELSPIIMNEGDSLYIEWNEEPRMTLSCDDCPEPWAFPLFNNLYQIKVSNDICSDSAGFRIIVDKTRKVVAANVFSPNSDRINDRFFLQSPDPGIIRSLRIFDRWGNLAFETLDAQFNDESTSWDGTTGDRKLPPGVYIWSAEIEFVDGEVENFGGDLTLLR